MDSVIKRLKALNHVDNYKENDARFAGVTLKEGPAAKISSLDKLFEELKINEGSSAKEDLVTEPIKKEGYLYKDYFNKSPIEFPWEKAYEKGSSLGPDFYIDYENVFENVANLAEIEEKLELHFRPFTCVMDFNCRFSMYELCLLLSESRFDPGSHPAVVVKITDPSAQVKIHAGGKISSTALNADSARTGLFKVIRILQDLDYKLVIKNFSKNIVNASFSMPFKIDMDLMSRRHVMEVTQNRSRRPFVTYTTENLGVRFAVFPTGFVLVLHSTSHCETREAIANFLPILAKLKNGYPTAEEKLGQLVGDISYKLLWEKQLEDDKEGMLLYS
ncbi:GD23169 [Drosophila simulans]|nr:GD23169 [Drosophila simulans]